jgi:hypothetical protein
VTITITISCHESKSLRRRSSGWLRIPISSAGWRLVLLTTILDETDWSGQLKLLNYLEQVRQALGGGLRAPAIPPTSDRM